MLLIRLVLRPLSVNAVHLWLTVHLSAGARGATLLNLSSLKERGAVEAALDIGPIRLVLRVVDIGCQKRLTLFGLF